MDQSPRLLLRIIERNRPSHDAARADPARIPVGEMHVSSSSTHATAGMGESGAALIISTTFVIDEGVWFVHRRHLQTEADAAVLAGARDFQYPCTAGGIVDERIAASVHHYDGTTAGGGGGYN